MTAAAAIVAPKTSSAAATVPAELLVIILIGSFAIDNILLLPFLGLSWLLAILLVGATIAGFAWLILGSTKASARIPLTALGGSLLVSLALFLLGGEGRFFYANADWQIRDAILNDMSSLPWPFAYALGGEGVILRAPLGMYLLPSLTGETGLHDIALLFSNSSRLAILIALASLLFDNNRHRLIALGIFLLFSGWDVAGSWIYSLASIPVSWDHLETWNFGFQYSSHITQAFWVPQHAIAGWASAMMFLLWRKGIAPVGWFAATVPLVALWSPLAIMGAVPFVMLAGVTVLIQRSFGWRDIGMAMLALAVALPALFYMQLDAAKLGGGLRDAPLAIYIMGFVFEVAPFIFLPLLDPANSKLERITLWTIFLCLLIMPFWIIGINSDFQMRASIMPLALLALAFAEWFIRTLEKSSVQKSAIGVAALAIIIGAATPISEVRRALFNPPSPAPQCSLLGVWSKQSGLIAPYATYLANTNSLPGTMKFIPAIAGTRDPAKCWDRKWVTIAKPE